MVVHSSGRMLYADLTRSSLVSLVPVPQGREIFKKTTENTGEGAGMFVFVVDSVATYLPIPTGVYSERMV